MTHGMRNTRVYRIWCWMHGRCRRGPYARRGITVCERWARFQNFLADMGEPPTTKHSIDRIDNDRGYEPNNCRWATRTTQARNTSQNTKLSHQGRTLTIAEWAEVTGIKPSTICRRLYDYGWSIDRALSAEVQPHRLAEPQPWKAAGLSRSAWYRARKASK